MRFPEDENEFLTSELGINKQLGRIVNSATPELLYPELLPHLHQRCAGLGERAPFTFCQADMRRDRLSLQSIPRVNQAVGTTVYVWIINLSGVPHHYQLGTLRHPGNDGFRFERG